MVYIIEFLIFAFLGWIVDSLYSRIVKKRKRVSGYYHGVPLCPIYGFGGILLLNTFAFLSDNPFWVVIPLATILVVILEYVGGWMAEFFLEEKLWDYSKERWNLNGFISAWHSFLWLITVSALYVLTGHKSGMYIEWLSSKIVINPYLEVLLIALIIGFAFWVTIKTKKRRLERIAKKRLEALESFEELFDFEKLEETGEEKLKEIFSNKNLEKFMNRIEKWRT